MLQPYPDIISKLGTPLWWDEVGCPRYEKFNPELCNNIYAHTAILLSVACQDCGKIFQVAHTRSLLKDATSNLNKKYFYRKEKVFPHYGDPLCDNCLSGPTMNCDDLGILGKIRRNKS